MEHAAQRRAETGPIGHAGVGMTLIGSLPFEGISSDYDAIKTWLRDADGRISPRGPFSTAPFRVPSHTQPRIRSIPSVEGCRFLARPAPAPTRLLCSVCARYATLCSQAHAEHPFPSVTSIPPPHLSSHRSSFSSAGCSSTQVVAQEGSATLFYGLTPTLIRSLPNLGISSYCMK